MKKIGLATQLTGRMTLKTKKSIFPVHTAAVIGNTNQPLAAPLDFDNDFAGLGVKSVFNQLFNNRCRALYNFSGSNLVTELFREYADLLLHANLLQRQNS